MGFNLTFICPEGQVFSTDWFATPFVMMTCQVVISVTFKINLFLLNLYAGGRIVR